MRAKKYLWTILSSFLFTSFTLSAQQTFVHGSVRDSASGEVLIGVIVRVAGGGGAATDVNGYYNVAVTPGSVKLICNFNSYRTDSVTLEVEAGKTTEQNFKLVNTSNELNIVVISSGRYQQNIGEVPVSLEVLKPKLIENKCTANMETIMDQVPGVTMTDGQANIRGGSGYSFGAGSRVLVVVDDMPMLSGDASDVKWNYLPIENVSQVEVMKGASSTLFGSSALNGVIHFRTAFPTDKPATSITMFSGFYDEPKRASLKWWHNSNPTFSGINFSHSRQVGNWDLVFGGHVYNDDGYRYLETEQRERFNMNVRYRFKKTPGLYAGVNTNMMNTKGGLFLIWYSDTLAYTPADSTIQNYSNTRFNIDPYINYYGPHGSRQSIRTRFYRTNNRNDTKQAAIADLYYGEYQFQHRFKNTFTITFGAVATYTKVHSDLYMDHRAYNYAGYLQLDRKFFDRLFVTVGIRGEYFRDDSLSTTYDMKVSKGDTFSLPFRPVIRAGITYQIGEGTFLRVSYGQGYRFPAIAEKYIRTSAAGLEIYPNHDLQPESGQSAEIGIKQGIHIGKGWKGYADVAIFWMQYSNMMEFAFHQWGTPGVDPLYGFGFKSLNIGSTRIRGVDCSIMGEGKIGKVDVMLLAGYTYMDPVSLNWNMARDTDVANVGAGTAYTNVLKYRYRNIGKFDAEATYKKFSVGASMRCNSRMENIDKIFDVAINGIKEYRDQYNTGDLVFDTRMMYQLTDHVRISLVTNNLLNREYTSRPADVQPPRNFVFQAVIKF